MPFRIATTAWPSSWSRIERKNSSALITASTKAFEPGTTSLVVPALPVDDQEQDRGTS